MAKCELCGARFGFKRAVSDAFRTFNGIEGYYPAQPYKQFNCDNAMVCDNCYCEISRALGIANGAYNTRVLDNSVIESNRQAVINKRANISNTCFADFIDFAIKIGERLIKGESDTVINGRKIARDFVKKKYHLFLQYRDLFENSSQCHSTDCKLYLYLTGDYLFYTKICFDLFTDNQDDNEFLLYHNILESFTYNHICDIGLYMNSIVHPIAVSDILYFCHDGEINYNTVVEGGGGFGGGVNTSGALLGGLLFGGIGALIGSQIGTEVKIEPVRSSIQKTDTRKTLLVKRSGNSLCVEEFAYDDYNAFVQLLPHKERKYVLDHPEEVKDVTPPPPPIIDTIDDEESAELEKAWKDFLAQEEKENEERKRKYGWYD